MDSIRNRISNLFVSRISRTVLMSIMGILTVAILNGAVISKYRIVINDTETITTVFTSEDQPNTILTQQNITLSENDTYNFSGIEENQGTININRAIKVGVNVDGATMTKNMVECTVAEALDEFNVSVNQQDLLNVSHAETIVDNMMIKINRVTYDEVTTLEEIPYDVDEIKTPTLKDNKRKILKSGSDGVLETVTRHKYIDGVIAVQEILASTVIENPVTAQVLVGDSDKTVSRLIPTTDLELDDNGNPINYSRKITGKATAYSSRGKTTRLKPGNVAMDLSQFPKGTKLYIKTPDGNFTYGYSEVKDTGHALVEGDILVDLFFASYNESCFFGAKTVDIYVL